MPGLGWMMKKSLFMDELLPQWPAVDQVGCGPMPKNCLNLSYIQARFDTSEADNF